MSKFKGKIAVDFRDSVPDLQSGTRAKQGSPNVVLIVLDDVGFAQLGCYGSDIETPAIDSLAGNGLRFRNFHTTALCSPTRSCLLTGRNHHSNHMGAVAELATGFPGYDFLLPKENGTLAEILASRGYATFAVGKWHLTPVHEQNLGASRERWPLGRGFERFYGFHGSDTDQYYPDLMYDNHRVPAPYSPEEGYHLSKDLVDKSIEFVRDLGNAAPDKPFFLYLAFGACHTPLQAPKEYIDKYAGRFGEGWDAWRQKIHQRQIKEGIIPQNAQLTARPAWIPAWDTLSAQEKEVFAKLMEVFAGFLDHTDAQIGRLVEEFKNRGCLDNTIIVLVSDNGASPEGGRNGSFNGARYLNGVPETPEMIAAKLDQVGGPRSGPHYPYGWAWAGNTPFQRWKQEVHEGGIQDPLIIHWPKGIEKRGEIRNQYTHAIDVMPTILELLGQNAPDSLNGVTQADVHGKSFADALENPSAPEKRDTQYYEVRGCRAIYHEGWKAVCYHPRVGLSWDGSDALRPYANDKWELYDLKSDYSEARDLSAAHTDKLQSLIDLWWSEAGRYGVLPLDNRGVARYQTTRRAFPYRAKHVLHRSAGTIREWAAVDLKNRSHRIIADLEIPSEGASGVILQIGSGHAGYALFVENNVPVYVHNYLSMKHFDLVSGAALPAGRTSLIFEFAKSGEHSGTARLYIGDALVGEIEIPTTIPNYFGGGEMSIGFNAGNPISPRYSGPFAFSGTIHSITIEVGDDGAELDPAIKAWIANATQ